MTPMRRAVCSVAHRRGRSASATRAIDWLSPGGGVVLGGRAPAGAVQQGDTMGRWKPGQSGNPKGRPPREREVRYMEIALSAVSFAKWREIVKRAAEDAAAGDGQARRWLSDYLMGPPTQRTEFDAVVNTTHSDAFEEALRKVYGPQADDS